MLLWAHFYRYWYISILSSAFRYKSVMNTFKIPTLFLLSFVLASGMTDANTNSSKEDNSAKYYDAEKWHDSFSSMVNSTMKNLSMINANYSGLGIHFGNYSSPDVAYLARELYLLKDEFTALKAVVENLSDTVYANVEETSGSHQPDIPSSIAFPKDCVEIHKNGNTSNGIYKLYPPGLEDGVNAYCEMDTYGYPPGWLVIQRRDGGHVNFGRTWVEYEDGFGALDGEFWFGLKKMNIMTSARTYKLRIDFQTTKGDKYAEYATFVVSSPQTMYRLNVTSHSGNADDSISFNNHMRFTTKDRDNDNDYRTNCADTKYGHGGFWYNSCGCTDLNRAFKEDGWMMDGTWCMFTWDTWIKKIEMKIMPAVGPKF